MANSEDTIEVRGIRYWSTPDYSRIAIELSGDAEFTKGRLPDPERLYFDLKGAKVVKGLQKTYSVYDRFIKTIRIGINANIVRVVFDLNLEDYTFKTSNLHNPTRFIIDILPKNIESKKIEQETRDIIVKRKIVVDAGHGGHDPGAIGPSGLREKDVVLDIARKVKEIIEKEHPLYEIILTRDSDVFIPLEMRAEIANRNNADLFISVHANASPNRNARGIETYLLNWTDDEEAMKVAARENAISLKKMRDVQNELGIILASLEREAKRDDSVKLAGYIQNSLVSTILPQYPRVNNLGVKQALFYVLVGAKVPSALVEVSFISNSEEERLLSEESYRQMLAHSIVSGIENYFSATPNQKIAVERSRGYKALPVKYTRRYVK